MGLTLAGQSSGFQVSLEERAYPVEFRGDLRQEFKPLLGRPAGADLLDTVCDVLHPPCSRIRTRPFERMRPPLHFFPVPVVQCGLESMEVFLRVRQERFDQLLLEDVVSVSDRLNPLNVYRLRLAGVVEFRNNNAGRCKPTAT